MTNMDLETVSAGSMEYVETNDLVADACAIVEGAQQFARKAVNVALVRRNWLLGKRIDADEMKAGGRARYGTSAVKHLARKLTELYGKGLTYSDLYRYVKFYRTYPEIFGTLSPKSRGYLSWSHYDVLLRVVEKAARDWYEQEALREGWSVRTLDRNVGTLYYERLLLSSDKKPVVDEMHKKTSEYEANRLEFIKNPVIAEFLGVPQDKRHTESELETAIIDNLQQFLMEMGKGYAFVARQQHIKTDLDDFYIDLVFYNYILKCFVLIDLKTDPITHQDVGQMDMYVRMYDDLKKRDDDNPTLGIVLCTETSKTIARYSVLHGNEQLFAAKYKLCLPSEEELRNEIENQKLIFALQHGDTGDTADGGEDEG